MDRNGLAKLAKVVRTQVAKLAKLVRIKLAKLARLAKDSKGYQMIARNKMCCKVDFK